MARRSIPSPPLIVLADKPLETGSSALVGRLKRELGGVRVGHTGTLDRFAGGLMILVLGRGTVFSQKFLKLDKSYRAVFELGRSTETHDPHGETLEQRSPAEVSEFMAENKERILGLVAEFEQQTSQVPPLYSALKKDGRRFSDHARAGDSELPEERKIRVWDVSCSGFDPEQGQLTVELSVTSGTYIRSFARDLGQALQFPVFLRSLYRTRVGEFRIDDPRVWKPDVAAPQPVDIREALGDISQFKLTDAEAKDVMQGRRVHLKTELPAETEFLLIGPDDVILAWAISEGHSYKYLKVFSN